MDVSPICTSSYQNLDIKSPKEADQKAGNRVRSFIGTALDHDAKKTPGMAEACWEQRHDTGERDVGNWADQKVHLQKPRCQAVQSVKLT